jgi:ankyrin repeat protein
MQEESKQRSQEELLFQACQKGSLDECKKLLSMGVDVNARDRNGSSALFHCCHSQQLRLVRFLLSMGLNPNLTNIRGNTALHLAAERGYKEVILILILYGADPYIYNLNGHRCDDLNPHTRPLIAGIFRDKSAYGLLSDFHKKKLTQIFEDIDSDDLGYIDANKSFKFNRFVEEISEDIARRDSQEFLKEVSICKEGQVNLEEWLFSFGKLIREAGNDTPVDHFIEDYERGIKEKGKFIDFKPRD